MKKSEFERRVAKAAGNERKTAKLYADLIGEKPSKKRDTRLRILENCLDKEDVEDILENRYAALAQEAADKRFSDLTGYGQCRGELLTYCNDVIVSCCKEMSALVAYGRAHVINGMILTSSPDSTPISHTEDGTYMINQNGLRLKKCPFCGARVVSIDRPHIFKGEAQ